eukprot:TRINITY_DN1209_c0_g1_i1.p1 TRINITY_DN1209_c0_g1~~TRINITY_DN1209_c0_g1_i1.p1  ORF type:complete len:509 (+),score=144.63 TRINITY_DN1209_c0_g1_i1:131-1657(+)
MKRVQDIYALGVLLLFLSIFSLNAFHAFAEEVLRQHQLVAPYARGRSMTIDNWEYGGSAIATESFVRLVPSIRSRVGHLWNTVPVATPSWRATLEFAIHNVRSPGADGMAFWYTKDHSNTGPLFGNQEDFIGFGIIFDTFDNDGSRDGPTVMVVHSVDGSLKFDHETDGVKASVARCHARFRNTANPAKARITFENHRLSVDMDTEGNGAFKNCLSVYMDVPTGYYFGLSAATGGFADYHDVHSFIVEDLSDGQHDAISSPSDTDREIQEASDVASKESSEAKTFNFDGYKQAFINRLKKMRSGGGILDLEGEKENDTNEPVNLEARTTDVLKDLNAAPIDGPAKVEESGANTGKVEEIGSGISAKLDEILIHTKELSLGDEQVKSEIQELKRQMGILNENLILVQKESQAYLEVVDMLSRRVAALHQDIGTLESVSRTLRQELQKLGESHGEQWTSLKKGWKNFSTEVSKSASWGYWGYFLLFQIILVVAYFVYKWYREERTKYHIM